METIAVPGHVVDDVDQVLPRAVRGDRLLVRATAVDQLADREDLLAPALAGEQDAVLGESFAVGGAARSG